MRLVLTRRLAFKLLDYLLIFDGLQVQSRVGQNHSVVQRLDAQMKQMGRVQLCRRFGGEELSCDFLGHSSVYLVKVHVVDLARCRDKQNPWKCCPCTCL